MMYVNIMAPNYIVLCNDHQRLYSGKGERRNLTLSFRGTPTICRGSKHSSRVTWAGRNFEHKPHSVGIEAITCTHCLLTVEAGLLSYVG